MRNLIALFACSLAISAASANDPPKPAVEPAKASAPAASAAAPGKASVPAASAAASAPAAAGAKPAPAPVLTAAQQRAKDDEAEAEVSAKIAARIAALRANQAARYAAAAKAKKAADERKKREAAIAAAPPPPPRGTHWSYDGEHGPANWSKINVDWAACNKGNRQSPIDIRDGMKVDLEKISFDYKPTSFSVVDNGHTIQVTLFGGNYITVNNQVFELQQFHFHRPSEERINGKSSEMVVHLVHKNPEGRLAVIAVLLDRGQAHRGIQTVWNNLPLEKHDVVNPSVVIDPSDFLPAQRDYYTYMGSLTTPPCTEGVLWMVMKQPMQAAPAQMALFSRLYPMNARPIQTAAGRVIKESL
jgi:carbonic anhydrase